MRLNRISEPETEPVSLEEIKNRLRIDFNTDDDDLELLISAAREYVESYLSKTLITTQYELFLDSIPYNGFIDIPKGPLQSIDKVEIATSIGVFSELDDSQYYADINGIFGRIYFSNIPTTICEPVNVMKITFTAGYGDEATSVPKRINQIIRMIVSYWYNNRDIANTTGDKQISLGIEAVLGMIGKINV